MSFNVADLRGLPTKAKIHSFDEMPELVHDLTEAGATVVLAQGVFDLIHLGHIEYLRAALKIDTKHGFLVVGVESDESVRINKGSSRPINPADDRMNVLAEFLSVGMVFTYKDTPNYDTPQDYIARYKALSPAAIAVPTWDPHRELKKWQAKRAGSKLALIDYKYQNSTTAMLKRVGYEE